MNVTPSVIIFYLVVYPKANTCSHVICYTLENYIDGDFLSMTVLIVWFKLWCF